MGGPGKLAEFLRRFENTPILKGGKQIGLNSKIETNLAEVLKISLIMQILTQEILDRHYFENEQENLDMDMTGLVLVWAARYTILGSPILIFKATAETKCTFCQF